MMMVDVLTPTAFSPSFSRRLRGENTKYKILKEECSESISTRPRKTITPRTSPVMARRNTNQIQQKPALNFDLFLSLPYELQYHVLKFVTFKDMITLKYTSKAMLALANENALWRELTMKHWQVNEEHLIDFGRGITDWEKNFKLQLFLHRKEGLRSDKILAASKPAARFGHSSCVVDDKIYYIGGQVADVGSVNVRTNDIYSYDAAKNLFNKIEISNHIPNSKITQKDISEDFRNFRGVDGLVPSVARHQSVAIDGKIYVFGGYDYIYFYNLAVFDPKERTWTYPEVTGKIPAPRSNHSSAVVGDKFYIFGGSTGDNVSRYTVTQDFYMFDTKNLSWSHVIAKNEPSGRVGHVMTAVGKYIYLFGGGLWGRTTGWTQQFNDLYAYNTENNKWKLIQVKAEEKPPVSTYPYIFTYGKNIFVFGGASTEGNVVTNKLYMWDILAKKWSEIKLTGDIMSARSIGCANVVGEEIIIWGGYCGGILKENEDLYKIKLAKERATDPKMKKMVWRK